MISELIPTENLSSYSYIYVIENGLREFIIYELEKNYGARWYKQGLPGDILNKYKIGIQIERNVKWSQMIPHHPIYYIDFPDLKKIIERGDNWKNVFQKTFQKKDVFIGTLSEIEFIRNKIAHNRKVTLDDTEILKSAFVKLSDSIGKDRFQVLLSRCTCVLDITEQLKKLKTEIEVTYIQYNNYDIILSIETWNFIHKQWWFEETYLDNSINCIVNYFSTIEKYQMLDRKRGKGYTIENWVTKHKTHLKYNDALEELKQLIKE